MSLNPNLKECRVDKAQDALVDFVSEVKRSFEVHGEDLNNIPVSPTLEWAKSVLQGSQEVKCPDADRQLLIDDLRHFTKEIRKAFTKHSDDLNEIPIDRTLATATSLLTRAGVVETVAPVVQARRPSP
jgi:hypothetical protein